MSSPMPSCSRTVVGVAGDRHLHAGSEAAGGQRQQEGLQEHADAESVDVVEVAVHADDSGERGAEELPVAQHGDASAFGVVAGNAHRPVDQRAEVAPHVGKGLRQNRHTR